MMADKKASLGERIFDWMVVHYRLTVALVIALLLGLALWAAS